MNLLGHHIFISSFGDEVSDDFSSKISEFHDLYVDLLLLHEIGLKNNLKKNPHFDEEFYNLLIKGLKNASALIMIDHVSDLTLDVSCSIYYLADHKHIEGFYMTQIVSDWDGSPESCHQIWKINDDSNLLTLNRHWF